MVLCKWQILEMGMLPQDVLQSGSKFNSKRPKPLAPFPESLVKFDQTLGPTLVEATHDPKKCQF